MTLPDKFLGIDGKEALKKYLEQQALKPEPEVQKPASITPATAIADPQSYLILPSRKHGSYEYPDLLVAKERSHLDKTWDQAHQELAREGAFMLTMRQYVDVLNLLRSGTAYDGTGKKAPTADLDHMLDEITTVRPPYRAEWLDALFGKQGRLMSKHMYMGYHKIKSDGTLEQVREPLEECLMSNKTPGIDLADWLARATPQGLPPQAVHNGDLYYWYPRDGTVARFGAYSGWANLDCGRGLQYSDPALGVRAARVKT